MATKRQWNPNKAINRADGTSLGVSPSSAVSNNKPSSDGSWINTTKQSTASVSPPPVTSPSSSPTATPSPSRTSTPSPTNNQSSPLPITNRNGIESSQAITAGADKDVVSGVESIYNPLIDANRGGLDDEKQRKEEIMSSLDEEQKIIEEGYANIKDQYLDINQQQQQLVDESASIQTEKIRQQQSKEQFQLSQDKQKYEDEMLQAKRQAQRDIQEQEAQLSRSMASSIGGGKGFQAMMQYQNFQQDGVNMITDLKASTSWGMAEFGFKAQEIDRYYTTAINEIEVQRRDKNVTLLSELSNTLANLDEKVLISASEKQSLARDAINKYFDNKEVLDGQYASYVSEANATLAAEVENVKKEKEEKETFDLNMSANLGFFANKFGQPINTRPDGKPVPFVGQYDESLSAQFGHLVDSRGNAVLGSDGQQIPYQDPNISKTLSSVAAYLNGEAGTYDLETLNERVGENSAIIAAKKAGYYTGKYGDYQCGEFLNDQYFTDRVVGDTLQSKKNLITKFGGGRKEEYPPKVGDSVIMDMGTNAGHIALINWISEDQTQIKLTQANYPKPGVVSHDMIITKGSTQWKKIFGFADVPLKDEYEAAQPVFVPENPIDQLDPENLDLFEKYAEVNGEDAAIAALKAGKFGGKGQNDTYSTTPGSDSLDSSVSYPGRPKPAPWAVNYSDSVHVDEYGNVAINWSSLPKEMKSTSAEKSSAGYAIRIQKEEDLLNLYEQSGIDTGISRDIFSNLSNDAKLTGNTISGLVQQGLLSQQQADILQAQARWIEASMRKKSGAAISVGEYLNESANNFPLPGASNKENLRSSRQSTIGTFVQEAGNASIMYDAFLSAPNTAKPLLGDENESSPIGFTADAVNEAVNEEVGKAANAFGDWWNTVNKEIGKTNAPEINFDMSTLTPEQINQLFE